jgi:hypothetical protein
MRKNLKNYSNKGLVISSFLFLRTVCIGSSLLLLASVGWASRTTSSDAKNASNTEATTTASATAAIKCEKIVEIPLGGFGDAAAAKRFTKRFGPNNQFGALRDDTHLKYVASFITKKQCNLPKVYFSSLHYIEPSNLVLLESLAGSETQLALWDIVSCKEIWNAKKFGTAGQPVWYRNKQIIFRPTCWDCNAKAATEPCACDAAVAVRMKANCDFTPDSATALQITQKEIGVAFKGNKKIVQRFTPQAQVVK